ncbi:MAG: hypothetical protein A2Z14_09065 [Chloroflexi bacterium RBG_16_48_8]|nr:MAG: hypothetical protein A2Z14_09065 [Chloroflexi bacterium RBG_16_48_8]
MELLEVPDVGPKRVASFWKELGITTLAELETAARKGLLQTLSGIGERTEKRILQNIEFMKSRQSDRVSIGVAWLLAKSILDRLRELPEVSKAQVAGSLRRGWETVSDLDFVVVSDDSVQVIEKIFKIPDIRKVISHGEKKVSIRLEGGIRSQIWVHSPQHFGSALQYATGSQAHNVKLREFASNLGYSLSEFGFKREDGSEILCPDETVVYETLGLPWIAPELR